jgi:hypothetical protein
MSRVKSMIQTIYLLVLLDRFCSLIVVGTSKRLLSFSTCSRDVLMVLTHGCSQRMLILRINAAPRKAWR